MTTHTASDPMSRAPLDATPPAAETLDDMALNMARQSLYRFAALTLLDPRFNAWKRLQSLRNDPLLSEAVAVVRETETAQAADLGLGERALEQLDLAQIWERFPSSEAQLNAQYERTFGLLVSAACPPYETEYINSKYTFQRSQTLADVSGYYRAFGLTTSSTSAERPDHIVLELEFMAFLLSKERQAHQNRESLERQTHLDVCRRAQRRFLSEHLAVWASLFAKLVQRENPGGFYEAAGIFLAALIPAERGLLGVAVPDRRPAAPSQIEPLDACDGCQLHGDPQLGT
ncbi:MAG: molecular chaperone TorD family protein [Planctomycetales bacterium]|nr:molecular chaperone TorD family protein [Planctomycetales bacterium]